MQDLGRMLLVFGLVLAAIGGLLLIGGRIPWLGRLPGDLVVERGSWTVYVPLASSIVVSVVLTLLLNLFWRR